MKGNSIKNRKLFMIMRGTKNKFLVLIMSFTEQVLFFGISIYQNVHYFRNVRKNYKIIAGVIVLVSLSFVDIIMNFRKIGYNLNIIRFLEYCIAIVVFQKLIREFYVREEYGLNSNQIVKVKEETYNYIVKSKILYNLRRFEDLYLSLANSMSECSKLTYCSKKLEAANVSRRIICRVCSDCNKKISCWELNLHSMNNMLNKLVESVSIKGFLVSEEVQKDYKLKCQRIDDIINEINILYELHKLEVYMEKKAAESRGLVLTQTENIACAIRNLADSLTIEEDYCYKVSQKINKVLINSGLISVETIVIKKNDSKLEVYVVSKNYTYLQRHIEKVKKIISENIGKTMEYDSMYNKVKNTVRFIEKTKYKISLGIQKIGVEECDVSGDSYSCFLRDDGKQCILLADGMGCGQLAKKRSSITIGLLEQFLENGFDKECSIKHVNSILLNLQGENNLSTIDISMINLNNGETEFLKVGAVPTFIKRKNDIEIVRNVSLPAGILEEMECELARKILDSGDFIIMMSDGVYDAFFDKGSKEESFLVGFLKNINHSNPQRLADEIISAALRCNNKSQKDDMMVIVAKIE